MPQPAPRRVGRYLLFDELASGGMASVYLGRLVGTGGFVRTVAVKQLHPQYAKDPELSSMLLDEARIAARVTHGNVVTMVDVVAEEGELFLVMEYVHGEPLSRLWRGTADHGQRVPVSIVSSILSGTLHGLHAAHEATSEQGEPLGLVHRDVSPQNILVGTDGIARILDFGIAKAKWRVHTTRDGSLKGKIRYMAPEQLRGEKVDRRVDVFSAGVVLWEMLTGRRMFPAEEPNVYVQRLLGGEIDPPSRSVTSVSRALDEVVMRALANRPEDRFPTARDFALALELAVPPAPPREVGDWVEQSSGRELALRRERTAEIERFATQGADLPPHLAAQSQDAKGRAARAQLPTVPEGVESTEAQDTAQPSTETPSPSAPRTRRRAAWVGLVLVLGGVAVWSVLRAGTTSGSGPRLGSAPASAASMTSSVTAQPSMEPLHAPSGPPPEVPVVAAAVEPKKATRPAAGPRTAAASSAPIPRPAASKSAGLCMKLREDGVVYFEPCR